jgi:hypothetical protein
MTSLRPGLQKKGIKKKDYFFSLFLILFSLFLLFTMTEKECTIFDLSLDIKYIMLEYLDNRSLAYLAQTCKYFGKYETTKEDINIHNHT